MNHPPTRERTPRAQPRTHLRRADGPHHGLRDLQGEARPILNGAPIRIGSVVRDVLQELIQQISIRVMDLHAVEPGAVHRVRCGRGETPHVFLDFRNSERAGGGGVCAELDIGRGGVLEGGVFSFQAVGIGLAARGEYLEVDETSFRMHGVGDLRKGGRGNGLVNAW